MVVAVILAAGKGTRMKSDLPKVLHPLLGKPMIQYVVDVCREIKAERILAVVGYQKQMVLDIIGPQGVESVIQNEQFGTGHAVLQAEMQLKEYNGNVLVLCGDVPLISADTLNDLIQYHEEENAYATVLTCEEGDPTGYGRIIRNLDGSLKTTVEERDIQDESIRKVKEVSTGIFLFRSKELFEALKKVNNSNSQCEYYLPDVLKIFVNGNKKVGLYQTQNLGEIHGINTKEQLEKIEKYLSNQKDVRQET